MNDKSNIWLSRETTEDRADAGAYWLWCEEPHVNEKGNYVTAENDFMNLAFAVGEPEDFKLEPGGKSKVALRLP